MDSNLAFALNYDAREISHVVLMQVTPALIEDIKSFRFAVNHALTVSFNKRETFLEGEIFLLKLLLQTSDLTPKIATYDLKPEMSAYEVTDEAVRKI